MPAGLHEHNAMQVFGAGAVRLSRQASGGQLFGLGEPALVQMALGLVQPLGPVLHPPISANLVVESPTT